MVFNVIFNPCEREKYISGLWQYNYGHVLAISGLELPEAVKIEFSLQEKAGTTIPRTGITKDGVATVAIPNNLLANEGCQNDYRIYAFVYVEDGEQGYTYRKITLSVKSRPKPGEYDVPDEAPDYVVTQTKQNTENIEKLMEEKVNLPIGEDGNLEYGEEGEALVSNGDGTYRFKKPALDFAAVEFDNENRYLHFLDAKGEDVYKPVYIEGGGGGGSQSVDVKLTNDSDFTSTTIVSGDDLEVAFTFTSTDDGVSTGLGTCQVIINGITKLSFNIQQGSNTVKINSKLLASGSNTIKIKCIDVYGNFKIISYDITVVDIYLTSTFDDTLTYNDAVQFKYIPYGAIEKVVHVYLDGEEVHTETTTASGRQTTISINGLTHGTHRLEAYITAAIGEKPIESPSLKYDIMYVEEGRTEAMISSVYSIDKVTQGEQVSIPYIVHDPAALYADIALIISNGDGQYSSQEITVDRTRQYWNVRNYPAGEVSFTIKYGEIEKTHIVNVTEADIDTTPVTNDLELYLTSAGRSNNEANPGVWEHGNVATTFQNVNWDSTGWIADENGDTVLRLNGGASAEISFQPFATDFKGYGKTIEIEFAIRDVNNREAVVLSCMNDGIGMEVTADRATLRSEQSEISCNFCDEERIRVSFVVESRSEYRLLQIYLNGILSGTKQYPATDNFQQTTPVNIVLGSPYCGVDIYTIRSYTNALTFTEVINNYISDIPDMAEKAMVFESNDIYDEYSNMLYEEVKKKIPVMTIIGSLPQSKGDKKDVVVKFEYNTIPGLNYEDNVSLDVQGTSSQWFVRKNFKGKTTKAHKHAMDQMPSRVFCVKADYAEATGTHNTQNANLVETLYSEKTPAQLKDARCRTTIYGYPIVIFHQETADSTPVFIGKYNYNFDKGSEEVYGFDGSFDVESWEFLNNTSDMCNFLAPINSSWAEHFEARYPDKSKDISRFKIMHDWVVSTKGNVEKFRNEFEEHFDLHFALIYYVYTSVMLMVDQRAKNMFLTYWADTGKWQPWFYDNDTCLGINNEGQVVFDYYHEDIDTLNGANVYNGQNSTLWVNFREAFADEIKETYQDLRNNGKLTYEKILEYFVTNGSDKWSESIYNEDADYKYISMLRSSNDATNLYQVRGDGEEHLKYFVSNRLKYMDSKWYASDYADNYVSLRIYTPAEWSGVKPNADITIVPFSNMYAGVRYKANGALEQIRVEANEEVTFEAPDETFNDTETAIYGASEISSLGDLAPLYCGSINVSKAKRLIHLKAGDATAGYQNTNLTELSVGTNKLLKVVDVRNCPNLTDPLVLTGCPNIEEIYATGSGITGVELPKSGYLKKIHLPATITNLTLQNQIYIEDFTIASCENVSTLNLENCPTLDELDILEKCVNIKRVRLAGVNWRFDNASSMLSIVNNLIDKGIKGVDENGLNVDVPQISGRCHIAALTGEEFALIKETLPYMTITYSMLTTNLIFMLQNGTELTRQTIINGGNGYDPIEKGDISAPTMDATAQYKYTYSGGWSTDPNGVADANALLKVEADRILYPVFTREIQKYSVYFYNGTELLQTVVNVPYGDSVEYLGDEPVNNSTGNPDDFEFIGWEPKPENIQGDTYCYAQYADMREITDSWATIAANVSNGTATSLYSVDRPASVEVGAIELPYKFYSGASVVLDDEVHILGGSASAMYHYKWNGSEWESVSTLPARFVGNSAVVLNGDIHILAHESDGNKHYKWNGTEWVSVSTLPYNFRYGSSIILNNEIHILGGDGNKTSHYKWNGAEWVSVSTLPCNLYQGSAVVLNGEIHTMGGNGTTRKHYKWNGAEWSSVSTLPYDFKLNASLVYNNEIHILGGANTAYYKSHYKWNGSEWVLVSTLPCDFYSGSAVVLNNEVHILGSGSSSYNKSHYIYNGTEWTANGASCLTLQVAAHNKDAYPDGVGKWSSLGELPYDNYDCSVVIVNDGIHMLGGSLKDTAHYKWNGSEWVSISTLPYSFMRSSAVVLNDEIHIMGGYSSSYRTSHYKWNGSEWVSISTLPYGFYYGSAVVLNDEIHILGTSDSSKTSHYKWNGTEWISVSTLPYSLTQGFAVVYDGEIHIMGTNAGSSVYKAHYKWTGTEWVSVSTLPYNFYAGSAVVYDGEIHIMGSGGNYTAHYKWNGTEWVSVSTLPYDNNGAAVVVYDNTIYMMGGRQNSKKFYSLQLDNCTASLTFVGKLLLKDKRAVNTFNTNAGGWSAMALREYLNGEFVSLLPAELQSALTTVKKISDSGYDGTGESTAVATNDKVWLLSAEEVQNGSQVYPTIFKNASSRIKQTPDGQPSKWWLRSSDPGSMNGWKYVTENGEIATTNDVTEEQGILIGFCI